MVKNCINNKRRKLSDPKKCHESTTSALSVVNKIDRISILPDCLLCHILSFLPNTTSVIVATTSVLSRRWRYVWKDLPTFHFNQPSLTSVKTFLSLCSTRGFRKFHLHCRIEEKEISTVKSWVETAIGSNLEELKLNLSVKGMQTLVMPLTIFSCTALVTLSLNPLGDAVTVLNRSSYHLPSLKNLSLFLESPNNLEALLSGCPVLETLNLYIHHICPNLNPNTSPSPNPNPNPDNQTIRVVSSSLKRLNIDTYYHGVIIKKLEIDAASLENLCLAISGGELDVLSARNLLKVETADLQLSLARGGYSLMELLNEIRNACDLSLNLSPMDSITLHTYELMEFNHLLRLHLTARYFDTKVMMDMLGKCNVLQELTIMRHEEGEPQEWTEPVEVPNCLVSHLERVTFFMYLGTEEDKEFVRYILQKGLILKSVIVWADPMGFDVDSTDKEELSLIPTASKMCQLEMISFN
ncbi:hypothetical protein PIB30_057734 [Stylosanthes scabra]|uniref:FBD domain-containing protein n=1 Tax=Stylosanthes scabra TaxID=79078 RepID=A0ABU6SK11_9FABA|nr:hypothetical protein [Stylosanthes scabra]